MTARSDQLHADLLRVIHENTCETNNPISNLLLGPPLVAMGYTQDEIVNAMFSMNGTEIEMMAGNRIRSLKSRPISE